MRKEPLISPKISINNFDLIRFVLASAVIYCHCFVIYYGYDLFKTEEAFMAMSQGQISIGSVAVNFFFIISGFLIVRSFEYSASTKEYLVKRVLRIYPGFIIAFLISIFLVGFFGELKHHNLNDYVHYLRKLHKKEELIHLLTLQSPNEKLYFKYLPQSGLNNSLWTIQFEFICYLLVPIMALLGFFKRTVLFIVAFVLAYLVLLAQQRGIILPYQENKNLFIGNTYHFPRFIVYFLAGACFYIFKNKIQRSYALAVVSFVAIAFSFVWIKCVDQVLPVAGSYLLFYFAYHRGLQFSGFSKDGDCSYGLYLYGWPVQQILMQFSGAFLNPFRFFFIVYPVVLGLAYASWHLVEKKFLRLKSKKSPSVISISHYPRLVKLELKP